MSGRILSKVISDERHGKYLGQTIQFIPHVTNASQQAILDAAQGFDVHIVEIGGTVGDYEGLSFLEAIRELPLKVGRQNCLFVHVVYLPYLGASQEFKTKPAQNAIRELRGLGIVPDLLMARSEAPAPAGVIGKLSLFAGVPKDAIALLPNAPSIYQVPLTLEESGIADVISQRLDLKTSKSDLKAWRAMVKRATTSYKRQLKIGIVAKYLDNQDTYMSVFEALRAAAWWQDCQVDLRWIDAQAIEEKGPAALLDGLDGIVVPGGFGTRGLEGKIQAAQYCMDTKMPYLGLCLGLQMAVIAAARRAGLKDATTMELDPQAAHKVIDVMDGQADKLNTGGTMRLGDYPCNLQKSSLAAKLYGSSKITERHRHRLECNNHYRADYPKWGINPVGLSPDGRLVEIIEVIGHPFMMASQFHPEFKSRPDRPHPMFSGFISALL
jgi:CTP synthase